MDNSKQKAVRFTECSSCGAQVPIYSRASVQSVCPFCRSTLVRTDMRWEDVGKMAVVANDLSPFTIGMSGTFNGKSFTIIGRIQQQYSEGMWNEWLLSFSDSKTAWLSEGSGMFYLTQLISAKELLPSFDAIELGKSVLLEGKSFSVSNIERARCIATEGEIPFSVGAESEANLVDLTGENAQFACLDYSDANPLLYIGRAVDIEQLNINIDLKVPAKLKAESLVCAGCGNSVTLLNPASQSVVCVSCGMANEYSNGKLLRLFSQENRKGRFSIPVGTKGVLEGVAYEVIGAMERTGGGDRWAEYLLYSASKGVRWLVCANGHWSLLKTCPPPSVQNNYIYFNNRSYKHFSTYRSSVNYVLGEFYWKLGRGESAHCVDFVCPPFVLSSEKNGKEIVWSEGYYLQAQDVAAAFSIKPPSKRGVGINQPSPIVWKYFAAYIIALCALVMVSQFVPKKKAQLFNIGELHLTHNSSATSLVSDPFVLTNPHGLFEVSTRTNVNNDWVDFEYRLINQATGEARMMNREVAYYYGTDGDGSWSEGSTSDTARLSDVTAGTYVLEVDADTERAVRPEVDARISVAHGRSSTSNLLLMVLGLALGPALACLGWYLFERQRWSLSDHPWE